MEHRTKKEMRNTSGNEETQRTKKLQAGSGRSPEEETEKDEEMMAERLEN